MKRLAYEVITNPRNEDG